MTTLFSERTFQQVLRKLVEDKDRVGVIQLHGMKDLLDNPDETLATIASSLHRDVNEAYNAHSSYVSG